MKVKKTLLGIIFLLCIISSSSVVVFQFSSVLNGRIEEPLNNELNYEIDLDSQAFYQEILPDF